MRRKLLFCSENIIAAYSKHNTMKGADNYGAYGRIVGTDKLHYMAIPEYNEITG